MFSNIVKLLAFIIFLLFFILVFNYYFSEKNLNRVINQRENIQTKMIKNTSDLPILKNNTKDVIEFNSGFENNDNETTRSENRNVMNLVILKYF